MTVQLSLNESQREAVAHRDGPLLVLAGAGSGKTRVLTARLVELIREGIPPRGLMAVTFTNKAAQEMRRRVAELVGFEPAGLWIGTFHSIAARFLRRESHHIGFTPQFTIYDETDRLALIKRLLKQGGYSSKAFKPGVIQAEISRAKNGMVSPAEYAEAVIDEIQSVAAAIYEQMNAALASANAMDFDDLLLHPLHIFETVPHVLQKYQSAIQSVLVDEFQDTNRAQYLFVQRLAQARRDICAVGDDDQSIYGWRGADVRNMLDFQHDFGDARLIRLEENYRSTSVILDAANHMIAENTERLGKTLFTSRAGGDPVVVVTTSDERDEAEWVLKEIRSRPVANLYDPRDIAILYRTNSQSRAFEDVFRRNGVPYRVVGAVSFYGRREIKDLVAYLRLVVNPNDDESFLRASQVPKRGIGLTTLSMLQARASAWDRSLFSTAEIADRVRELKPRAQVALQEFTALIGDLQARSAGMPAASLLELLIQRIDYESYLLDEGVEGTERMENVRALVAGTAEFSEEDDPDDPSSPLERYLATTALTTSAEQTEGDPDGITLSTVHAGKGLEWPVVFLTGLEDGLFPLARSFDSLDGIEEERRLAYVGVTRAKDRLYMTWARARRRAGQLMPGMASRFLDAIPASAIEERSTSSLFAKPSFRKTPGLFPQRQPAATVHADYENESQDAPRYVRGERVRHRKFGGGDIINVTGRGRALKVTVRFDDGDIGIRTLLAAYAGLERDWDPA